MLKGYQWTLAEDEALLEEEAVDDGCTVGGLIPTVTHILDLTSGLLSNEVVHESIDIHVVV